MIHLLLLIIYLTFISLGLPDGILGAAWPAMQAELHVPISWMGPVFLLISLGTVVSSLLADRMCRKFGTAFVTAFSVAMTAGALIGFAFSKHYWLLCLWAIPYGLGAGSVDACLNNYVAIHYSGKHMSWLHCMWGIGASVGPYIMGAVLSGGQSWGKGYLYIGIFQALVTACLFVTLPAWKKTTVQEPEQGTALSFKQIFALPNAKAVFLAFFCYCALEQTIGQWAATYFYSYLCISEDVSASLAGMYFVGITVGRAINGFLTLRFSDKQLVRTGIVGIVLGILIMLLPLGMYGAIAGVLLIGLGSAPIYPCIIHATPALFGNDASQAIIGVEMAFAYVGICVVPPLYGIIADYFGIRSLLWILILLTVTMFLCHERLYTQKKKAN